jgi:hypothetical protein
VLIIVEGPDLAGKSTLVEAIEDAIHLTCPDDVVNVTSAGPPTMHPLDEYVTPLLGYRPGRDIHVICDRWHWGERVYPMLLGRHTEYDLATHRYVEYFLQSRGAIVVQVVCDDDTLAQRHRRRGDDLVELHQLPALRVAYVRAQRESILNGLITDVPPSRQGGDLNALALRIIKFARQAEHLAVPLSQYTTYVGHPAPELLLLGDVRHEYRDVPRAELATHCASDRRPAFMPYPATSGQYLLRALTMTNLLVVNEFRVGIMNACDVDDASAAWTTLGCPEVVTLGTKAADCLEVPWHWQTYVRRAPHPQYVRRFFSSRIAEYRNQLLLGESVSWRRDTTVTGR